MKEKRSSLICFFIGAIIGFICFIFVYGWLVINPKYDDWLFIGGDLTQHYAGWLFFRDSDWSFPFGMIKGLSTEPVSIIYTDSIPMFAVIFKILSPILPEKFQYFGVWGAVCLFLQGGFATLIVKKYVKNYFFIFMSTIFISISTVTFQRMFGHTALAGNWIILMSICVCVNHEKFESLIKKIIIWSIVVAISVSVHQYYVVMTYIFIACFLLIYFLKNKSIKAILNSILVLAISAIIGLFILFLYGAFEGEGTLSTGGLGQFSANVNTLFNSSFEEASFFTKPLPVISHFQGEGFGYLGLGMILLSVLVLIFSAIYFVKQKNKKKFVKENIFRILPYFIVFVVAFALAISPTITFFDKVIFEIKYPFLVTKALGIFRASGRFIWINYYLIYVFAIVMIYRLFKNKKIPVIILSLCLCLNLADLHVWLGNIYKRFSTEVGYESALKDEKWAKWGGEKENIVFLPIEGNYLEKSDMYYLFAEYANRTDMTLSSFCVARADFGVFKNYADTKLNDINNGIISEDDIYIFTNDEFIPKVDGLSVYELDGYKVGVKK